MRELLAKGANIEAVTEEGRTALHLAALVNPVSHVRGAEDRHRISLQSLHIAALNGHDAVVRESPWPNGAEGQLDLNPNLGAQRSRERFAKRVDTLMAPRLLPSCASLHFPSLYLSCFSVSFLVSLFLWTLCFSPSLCSRCCSFLQCSI